MLCVATRCSWRNIPRYDRVVLLFMESEEYRQIIGNSYVPIINALARDYRLATSYRSVADQANPTTSPCPAATPLVSTAIQENLDHPGLNGSCEFRC
jgi:hypothetical protein